ncbi:MAG: metallophosphoesterase [Desulfobulbaceae bacterium]|nr:metallophosphoesterase [Desulfobulbaceae bacterium]
MHFYVWLRTYSIPLIKKRIDRKKFITWTTAQWFLFILSLVFSHDASGPTATVMEFLAMNWLGVLFLATALLLPTEILTGFGFFFKRSSSEMIRAGAVGAALLLSAIALIQGLRAPVISSHDISLSGLPPELDGTIMVAVSDLHLGSQLGESWIRERIEQIHELKPDIVVLVGDIVEGHGPALNGISSRLRTLSPPLGVWAVNGNHEFFGGVEKNRLFFEKSNINLLRNLHTTLAPGLILAGIDDLTYQKRFGAKEDYLGQALTNHQPGALILLSHSPLQAEKAAALGADLMLSGHTHNGQIWLLNYLVSFFYPLIGGRYEIGTMTLLVCRGTGTWGPRMRLWSRGEILKITLHSKS